MQKPMPSDATAGDEIEASGGEHLAGEVGGADCSGGSASTMSGGTHPVIDGRLAEIRDYVAWWP